MAGAFGDITPVQNTLLDVSLPYLAATKYQLGQNALATGQQDLTDRDTLRGLAGGLTSRDPNALGTAASLGSTGQGAVTALSTSDAQTAASKLAALQYTAGLPQWNGPASGGGAPAPGGAGGGASGGGDILDRLGVGESSNRPGVVNSQGYSGMFQFGTGRLKDLGLYQPAQGENPNGNQWKGTFNIPGFPQVQTYQQFLASPDAQRAAVHVHAADIDQNIAATPGADQLNRNGLVAVAHLGGVGGMQKFVQTGGQYNPADSNGTHLSDYYSRYSQAGLQQLANDHGHPAGPLPGYNPAQIAPGDAFAGPGMAGASVSSAVPVQVASNINARGMPQTANDASSAGGIPVPPIPPASGAPLQNNDDVTAVDSADGAQGLPAGARYSVGGGPIQVKPGGGSATGPAGMSSQQAVAEAQQELAGRQQGMDPAAANQQVIERARLLMQGASAPASSFAPSAASSTPPQAALLPARPSSRTDVPSPAGRPVNSLLASLPPSPVTGTPPQPNALLASLGLPPGPTPAAAPQAAPGPAPAPPFAAPGTSSPAASSNPAAGTFSPGQNALMPTPPAAPPAAMAQQPANPAAGARFVTTGTGAYYTQGLPAGHAYAVLPDGSRTALPLPGTQKLEIKDAGNQRAFIDPHTGQTVRTETIPDHSRMTWRDTPAGQQGYQSGQPVGAPIPFSGRPEQDSAYKADVERSGAITQSVQAAQANAPRLNEMADLAQQLKTGPTADLRAKAAAYLESVGVAPETIKGWTGLQSGSAAREFIKLSVQAAGADAKNNVGSNNGIQSIQLYQSANPGMALLPDANKRVTNMMRVANQATQDYGQGALQHFGTNEQQFLGGGQYAPLTSFNRQWQAQNNPQVYAAATGILNGDSFDKWRARLSSPDEGFRAAQIAARIDPNVMIPGNGGGTIPARQFLQRVR